MYRALICGAVALVCAAPAASLAQDAGYKAPRNAHGQPDLTGTWSNASLTPHIRPAPYGNRAVFSPEEIRILEEGVAERNEAGNAKIDVTAEHGAGDNVGGYDRAWIDGGTRVMRVRGEPRTSVLTTPDGMVPPRKGQPARTLPPGAGSVEAGIEQAKRTASVDQIVAQGDVSGQELALAAGAFDNPETRSNGERCLLSFSNNGGPPILSNGWYNNNYQLVQSRDAVAINIEMVHDTRIIRLNAKHRTDGVRPWFGDSIGRYEGDTLVVETTNIPQKQAYQGSWENLTVTERFTRVGKDRIHYQFTVSDPTMWDKPWGGEYEFYPLNGRIQEYACHEGNYALEGILAGAREAEKQAGRERQPVAAAAGATQP